MKASIRLIFCLFSISVFSPQVLHAQSGEADRGRLPDGRAYRTDSEGMQLVDYIAELEQNVAELNRKIISLEDENIDYKNQLQSKSQHQGPNSGVNSGLREKNLIENRDTEKTLYQLADKKECVCPQNICPEAKCPVVTSCPEAQEPDCDQVLRPVNARVQSLEADLKAYSELKARFASLDAENEKLQARLVVLEKANAVGADKQEQLRVQLAESGRIQEAVEAGRRESERLKTSLLESQQEIKQIRAEYEARLRNQEQEIVARLNQEYAGKEKAQLALAQENLLEERRQADLKLNKLQAEKQIAEKSGMEKLQAEVARLQAEKTHLVAEKDSLTDQLQQANMVNMHRMAAASDIRASMSPELEVTRHKAVDAVKVRLISEYQAILARKDERDIMFAKYVKGRPGLTLKPSSLRARSGRDLAQLEDLIEKAMTIRELAVLQADLQEIRRQMSDDLALIERMSKLQ